MRGRRLPNVVLPYTTHLQAASSVEVEEMKADEDGEQQGGEPERESTVGGGTVGVID